MGNQIQNWAYPKYEFVIEVSPDDILYLLRYKLEPWEVAEIVGEACHRDPKIRQAIIDLAIALNLEEAEEKGVI